MNRRQQITGVLLCILAILFLWAGKTPVTQETQCGIQEAGYKSMLATKNYCETDADCTTITACPFGCEVPVNIQEVAGINVALTEYHQQCGECKYKCQVASTTLSCRDNQCVKEEAVTP